MTGWYIMIRETGEVFPVAAFREPVVDDDHEDEEGILHIRRSMIEDEEGLLRVVWNEFGDTSFQADSLADAVALVADDEYE